MKISMTRTIVLILFVLALIPTITFSAMKWRSFVFTTPEEVSASPGQEVLINGTILNTGWWWLHNFSVTLEGLPAGSEYTITPNHWDELKITRDWNPQQGVFKIPEPILISIKVPTNAAGLYTVTLKGQENYSPYQFSNTTTFVLKIIGEPKLSISDISVPPVVYGNESFNVSFDVKNEGSAETVANATLIMPSDWTIDFKNKVNVIEPNATTKFVFTVTPTLSSGTIGAYVEYSYGKTVYNTTKEGPMLSPQSRSVQPSGPALPNLTQIFENFSPVLITILAVIIIVIAWILWSMYTMYAKRKKPESVKKQTEEIPVSPDTTTEVKTSNENLV